MIRIPTTNFCKRAGRRRTPAGWEAQVGDACAWYRPEADVWCLGVVREVNADGLTLRIETRFGSAERDGNSEVALVPGEVIDAERMLADLRRDEINSFARFDDARAFVTRYLVPGWQREVALRTARMKIGMVVA